MKPPLRIAILECDTPLDQTRHKYGGYGGVFKALLEAGAIALNDPALSSSPNHGLHITHFDVVNTEQYPALDDIDAVLLTGSRANAFDNPPWNVKLIEFTRKVLEEQDRVRVIGVCYGHQIMGRALGMKVDRSYAGWEISVMPMELTEKGKELFKIDGKTMELHQMHRDILLEYPDDVEKLASSPRCYVQGMYKKNKLITVQGHPEFNHEIVTELLNARHDVGVFDDTMYSDGMERVKKHHDGVKVSQAFLRFLLDD
ncbi:MAG: hypothetical protein M1821_000539 [Bathelium mastoideum]|nr:MAG: hypothetical protein M1821_000539 [Bathelium mastoideum]KAI9683004.1 MAG: hypothetical protein M1822_006197 [Bathelium mastoideum]